MNISSGENSRNKKKPIWVYSSSPLKRVGTISLFMLSEVWQLAMLRGRSLGWYRFSDRDLRVCKIMRLCKTHKVRLQAYYKLKTSVQKAGHAYKQFRKFMIKSWINLTHCSRLYQVDTCKRADVIKSRRYKEPTL